MRGAGRTQRIGQDHTVTNCSEPGSSFRWECEFFSTKVRLEMVGHSARRRCVAAFLLVPWFDQDFVPNTDNGRFNFMHSTSGLIGASDADILVSLKETHQATADYLERLRDTLPRDFSPELSVEDSTGRQGRFRAAS